MFAGRVLGALVVTATLAAAPTARSQDKSPVVPTVLQGIPKDQAETVVTGDKILAAASSGSMTAIWETLEFGEKVECLNCIPAVEPLLYDSNPRTREIAAWWLRRRLLGVFGPGQAYERTATALKSDASPAKRARAADALGEFLSAAGVPLVADALTTDADAGVRASAAKALGRLNSDGGGALGKALADKDPTVKVAVLGAASRINAFADVAQVATLLSDSAANVRRRAVELLGSMRAKDTVAGVMNIARNDPDEGVRLSACHALGLFGDASAKSTLSAIADSDTSGLVRDQAKIALRRL